jgi:hypothetical protein
VAAVDLNGDGFPELLVGTVDVTGSGNLAVFLNANAWGAGTSPAQVAVPNVVGATQAAASSSITGAGLVLGTVVPKSSVFARFRTYGRRASRVITWRDARLEVVLCAVRKYYGHDVVSTSCFRIVEFLSACSSWWLICAAFAGHFDLLGMYLLGEPRVS